MYSGELLSGRAYGGKRKHSSLCEVFVIPTQTQGSGQGCDWGETESFCFLSNT